MFVSNFGEDLDETLPNEVPLRLRGADKLSDSSIFAIYSRQYNNERLETNYQIAVNIEGNTIARALFLRVKAVMLLPHLCL